MEYMDRYSPEQGRRHAVKPGITGWAQINGRNALTWDEKFKLDVWYVEHQSLALDVWILARTVAAVLRRDGIDHSSTEPMPEFQGAREAVAGTDEDAAIRGELTREA
jgi:lipopolysaccharide/colanic/teichoic acid biosynthesis glycosyltransferase